MDPSRRGTLRPNMDLYASARLPVPPSAAKRATPSTYRQSIAGPQHLNPMVGPRQSLFPGQSLNVPPSASKMKNPAYGRTPMRNSVHKGSQWGAGRQSMVPPTPGNRNATRESRPIRDKSTQASMRAAICSFLAESDFEGQITTKQLASCTAKDFRSIFMHLILLLDNNYVFGEKDGKFEDEIILLLKIHAYPFADSIDKKWLTTPSSPFSWPSLLAMLHWLTELCKAKYFYLNSNEPTLQLPEQVPDNFDDPNHHFAIAFQYCSDAYGAFLDGSDDFREQDQVIEDRYARKNDSALSEIEQSKAELSTLTAEYADLTERPAPIVELEEEFASRTKDKKKFEDYFLYYENRKRKVVDAIAREEAEIVTETANLQVLRQEQEHLASIVKEQNLSPEEVALMKSEQESLHRTLEDLRRKSTELSNQARSVEITLAQRTSNVEQIIDEYSDLLEKLGIFSSVGPPLNNADIRLEANFAASDPRDLVKHATTGQRADLRNIKNVIDSLGTNKRRELQTLADEMEKLEDEDEKLARQTEVILEGIEEVRRQTNVLLEEAEALRNAAQDDAKLHNEEVDRLEKDLAQARNAALANGRGVKSRLQALEIAYQEQVERVNRLKEETVRNILKSSSDIAAFKEEVSGHLNHLRQFAEEN